jgi:hypothetical protein
MSGAIPPFPQYAFMAWCLVKHRDFTFYFTYATGWLTVVRFQAVAGMFSFSHRVQTGSVVHPTSYPIVTGSSFLGGKMAGA